MTRTVLVTGATGFVGRTVCSDLQAVGSCVRMAVRSHDRLGKSAGEAEHCVVGELSGTTDWRDSVAGVDAVVHLAARVHQIRDRGPELLEKYRVVNTHATLGLADACVAAGVRRFVYVSTIKVHGESSFGRPYRADDRPDPRDPYSISKFEAEQGLQAHAARGLEVAIIRPTLVYGPGVRANFLRLIKLVESGLPLPFGAIDNRRSLVSVWNLSSLILSAIDHPGAPGRAWLVSDGEDVTTGGLVRLMARAMGRPARLVPVPLPVLQWIGRLTGRGDEIARLTESLTVDINDTVSRLGWRPPVSLAEGIRLTVDSYLKSRDTRRP